MVGVEGLGDLGALEDLGDLGNLGGLGRGIAGGMEKKGADFPKPARSLCKRIALV